MRTLQTKCNNIKLKENGTPHIDRNRLLPSDRQPRLYRTGNRIQRVHDHSRILCKERESVCRTVFALSYAETELQYHDAMQETDSSRSMYVRKALSFVRKMLKYYQVGLYRGGAFDGGEKTNQRQDEAAAMQWTGSTAELVELIYGLDEMKLINGGETGIKELLARFCRMFGVEIKENQCYNTYADIKRRKNESRTYFFDRAAERLNRRMMRDEEAERKRR